MGETSSMEARAHVRGAGSRHRSLDEALASGTAALHDGLERTAVTRRRLLELAALAAMTQLPLPADAPAAAVTDAGVPGDVFRRSTYTPLVGHRFAIRGPEGASIRAQLVEIGDLAGAAARSTADDRAFSLLFHGPRSPRLTQGMYELRHPDLARDRLLLVPSGTGRRGQDYAVVINQSRAERG